jgi:hypothetical protein
MAALAAGLAVFAAGCGASQSTAPTAASATELPSNYVVEYDSLFQTPRSVMNSEAAGSAIIGAPAPFTDAVAFQIVRRFVFHYAPVFRFRTGIDDFVVTYASGHDGANIVKLQQTYRGLPVDVMGYGTTVLANGSVGSMIGRFMPAIEVPTAPKVSSAVAADKAIAALAPTAVSLASPPQLLITTYDLVPRLTWSAPVKADGSFSSWTVMVDADSGAVLAVHSNLIIN